MDGLRRRLAPPGDVADPVVQIGKVEPMFRVGRVAPDGPGEGLHRVPELLLPGVAQLFRQGERALLLLSGDRLVLGQLRASISYRVVAHAEAGARPGLDDQAVRRFEV